MFLQSSWPFCCFFKLELNVCLQKDEFVVPRVRQAVVEMVARAERRKCHQRPNPQTNPTQQDKQPLSKRNQELFSVDASHWSAWRVVCVDVPTSQLQRANVRLPQTCHRRNPQLSAGGGSPTAAAPSGTETRTERLRATRSPLVRHRCRRRAWHARRAPRCCQVRASSGRQHVW